MGPKEPRHTYLTNPPCERVMPTVILGNEDHTSIRAYTSPSPLKVHWNSASARNEFALPVIDNIPMRPIHYEIYERPQSSNDNSSNEDDTPATLAPHALPEAILVHINCFNLYRLCSQALRNSKLVPDKTEADSLDRLWTYAQWRTGWDGASSLHGLLTGYVPRDRRKKRELETNKYWDRGLLGFAARICGIAPGMRRLPPEIVDAIWDQSACAWLWRFVR